MANTLRRALSACLLSLLFVTGVAAADSPAPRGGEVTLPLADYLSLLDAAREAEQRSRQTVAPAIAELIRQHTVVTVAGTAVRLHSELQVEVRGTPGKAIPLPLTGYAQDATLEPTTGAALHQSADGGLVLTASQPGSYRVQVNGWLPLSGQTGASTLTLRAAGAAAATAELDLPADLAWSCPGAVLVGEEVRGERRHVQVALAPGGDYPLELRQRGPGGDEEALARAVVVTLVELSASGTRRHDLVAYEVSRGELESFTVQLPAGLDLSSASTDEGEVLPLVADGQLSVQRSYRLRGSGHLLLSARPATAGTVDLAPVKPSVPVRARYLVLTSGLAAQASPTPADAWAPVDLEDLPRTVVDDLRALRPAAVWRLTGDPPSPTLALRTLPPAETGATVVSERASTTLLTVDGTLVHRDRFVLRGPATAFDLQLPAGARLWSATVDDLAVRPVDQAGRLTVPLPFRSASETAVEVVAVQERAIPPGRSRLGMELATTNLPVLSHTWRVLLPEANRYRFASGELKPSSGAEGLEAGASAAAYNVATGPGGTAALRGKARSTDLTALPGTVLTLSGSNLPQPIFAIADAEGSFWFHRLPAGSYRLKADLQGFTPIERFINLTAGHTTEVDAVLPLGAVQETIVVTSEANSVRNEFVQTDLDAALENQSKTLYQAEIDNLQQGLVGGVKPLPVDIPESGKLLLLSGTLPPARVGVEVEVKARR